MHLPYYLDCASFKWNFEQFKYANTMLILGLLVSMKHHEVKCSVVILGELQSGPKEWRPLQDACNNAGYSRSNFYYHLKNLIKNGNIMKRKSPDGRNLYYLQLKSEEGVEDADPEEIHFLVKKLKTSQNYEAITEALTDFGNICQAKRLMKYGEVWIFFKEKLREKLYSGRLLGCLDIITSRAVQAGDEGFIKRIREEFLQEIVAIIMDVDKEDPVRREAVRLLAKLLTEDELYDNLMAISDDVVRKGQEDWRKLIVPLFDYLKIFYDRRKTSVWKWLYDLMENDDETIRDRGRKLLRSLRAGYLSI